jgi:hypothetical protein
MSLCDMFCQRCVCFPERENESVQGKSSTAFLATVQRPLNAANRGRNKSNNTHQVWVRVFVATHGHAWVPCLLIE